MLSTLFVINFLGMILLPILFAIWVTRKFHLSWKLLLAGALTFIASQVLHIPLVSVITPSIQAAGILVYAVVLGLLAGIFEETARWILYKFILKRARTWEAGVVVGAGHGGIEAVLLGAAAGIAFFQFSAYRGMDLSTVPGIRPDQVAVFTQAVAEYWSTPAPQALLGMVERIFAVCLHLSLSVMVLYSIAARKPVWFWLALLWHAFVDASAVMMLGKISNVALEGVVGALALFSLAIMFYLRPRFPKPEPNPEPPAAVEPIV